MHVTVPASSIEFDLPGWLEDCFQTRRSAIDSMTSDTATTDADLICRAFEFAYQLHEGQ